ncbi:MAG: hypothetical protein V9G14_04315 [Cypionkella sp.]
MAKVPLLAQSGEGRPGHHLEHKEFRIPWSDTKKVQNYGPWHNTYLAIYFTMTGTAMPCT